MDDYFDMLNDEERVMFSTIANHMIQLGYRAKQDKTSALGYTFIHSKVKNRIVRFSSDKGKPVLKVKYFASPTYSDFFHEAVRLTIEEYDYRYTGCYGCEKCDGNNGYRYRYTDGREYYRCGTELIELYDLHNLPLQELLALLTRQHEFFLSAPSSR